MDGWIKLYRKLLDHPVFKLGDDKLFKTFIYCLLRANHKEIEIFFNHQLISLRPGQFITGREQAAKDLRFSAKTFDRKIEDLKKLKIMTRYMTHRFSIISIINWETYQGKQAEDDPLNGTNMHGRCTEDARKMTTDKNDKNEKKKTTTLAPSDSHRSEPETKDSYFLRVKKEVPETLNQNRDLWAKSYPAIDLDQECNKALSWLIANPINRKKKIVNFLNNWLSRSQEKAPGKGTSAAMIKPPAEKKKTFVPCPQCKKETTQEDLDKFGTCPACFKPLPEEKVKELFGMLGKIGKDIPEKENGMKKEKGDSQGDKDFDRIKMACSKIVDVGSTDNPDIYKKVNLTPEDKEKMNAWPKRAQEVLSEFPPKKREEISDLLAMKSFGEWLEEGIWKQDPREFLENLLPPPIPGPETSDDFNGESAAHA